METRPTADGCRNPIVSRTNVVIRGVIIDFGGVLAVPPSPEALLRLQRVSRFDDADAFFRTSRRHRLAYDIGDVSADEFWRLVGSEAGRAYDAAVLSQLCVEDAACWAVPNTELAAWLQALRAEGLRLALLSNMPREQWAALKDGLAWLSACDVVVLSYEIGLAKPNPEIYRRCLDQMAMRPDEVLFIDDQPDNITAAMKLGLNALRFTTIEDLRRELAAGYNGIPLPATSAFPHKGGSRGDSPR
jgi:putative hydrolase of the HAD superfamily